MTCALPISRVYALRELVEFAATASGHPRVVVGLPAGLARAQAMMMELVVSEPPSTGLCQSYATERALGHAYLEYHRESRADVG